MRRSVGYALVLLLCVVSLSVNPLVMPSQAAAPPDEMLGMTAPTAAGSCWEIKQQQSTAVDGVYWLLTPLMSEPGQFYCDMSTDGGGWVLVGKGRDGWTSDYSGKGSATELLRPETSPMSAATHQLPSDLINQLLSGTHVAQLADGVRLKRARNGAGTRWQEVRFRLARQAGWTWTFGAQHPLTGFSFDGQAGSAGASPSFGLDTKFKRVVNRRTAARKFRLGFSYGPKVTGSSKASTYLYSASDGVGGAQPYTLVYLRPQVTSRDLAFTAIDDGGTPAISTPPVVRSTALPSPWGVSGTPGDVGLEGSVEVQAFTESNGRMYVGGNFRHVQQDASGEGRIKQRFLAAFDVATGEWVPEFRPKLNEQVRALATLPSGEILAGGDFTRVNGQQETGVVALDPVSGASSTTWRVSATQRAGAVRIRALDVAGPYVFLGGRFTDLAGGVSTRSVSMRNLGRVSAVDSTPSRNWNPNLNGSVMDVDASDDLSRVYASGYFTASRGRPASKAAVISNEDGAVLLSAGWTPAWTSATNNYQQAIEEVGDKIWIGGAEHSLFQFARDTFAPLAGNIFKKHGDVQAIESEGAVVYAGCHCNMFNYSGAYSWPKLTPTWHEANAIGWFGAWDAVSGEVIPSFVPTFRMRINQGIWAIEADSAGTVWAGGDIATVRTNARMARWSGGFARFPLADSLPPPTPTGLTASAHDLTTVTLSWDRVRDEGGGVRYQVLRDDRPVAATAGNVTTLTVPRGGDDRFFVRAVDGQGNVSSSTTVLDL